MDIFGDIKLPSGIGGFSLPQLPDLSSVASEVDSMLSGIGFNTDTLGIRNITDILNNPNLGEIKTNVYWQPLVDMDNIPDVTKSLDNFDISGVQNDINKLTSGMPDMESIDVSKFF